MAPRSDADILGVLELGDRALRDIESSGQLDLADRFRVAELVDRVRTRY